MPEIRGRHYQVVLAWGLLLLVLAGLAAMLVGPLLAFSEGLDARIERQGQHLARYEALLSASDRVESELQRVRNEGVDVYFHASGQTPALVATKLQQEINGLLRRSGGQILSSKNMKPETGDHFTMVRINLHLKGSLATVRQLLAGLEGMRPVVVVERFEVDHRGRRDWAKDDRQPQRLTLDIRLRTYIYRGLPG